MAPLSDDELVALAQGGDRNALDQLLRRHYDRVYAVCRRVTGSSRDADDACQEALIKITRSLPRFDGRAAFSTWAYRIATNASLDELRKRKRRPQLHNSTGLGSGSARDSGDGIDFEAQIVDPMAAKHIDAIADRLAIDEALGELSDDFKAAVVLRDVADLDYDEIADILEIPIGTVKSRIARGRAALAGTLRLGDLLDDPENTQPMDRPLTTEVDTVKVTPKPASKPTGRPGPTDAGTSGVTKEFDPPGNQADTPRRPTDSP